MTRTRRWLVAWRQRMDSLPRLEDALLGEAPLRYATYRLKYVMVRALLRTVFRLAELALFVSALPFEVLGPVLLVRSTMLVGESLWWGSLETLRRDVRTLHAAGNSPVGVIRQWLSLACCAGGFVMLASVAWVLFGPSPFAGFDVIDVFVLGCGTRLAIDLLVRTYHSGVYGIRRVYRPVWSLLLIDIGDVVALVGAYLWLGAWGLGLSLVVVGILRATLSVRFTRRVYAQLRLRIGSLPAWFTNFSKATWSPKHSAMSALGNVVGQTDALIVVGLLAAPTNHEDSLMLAVLFHGVAPLQTAAFSWSRLFYFDFKRLEAWGSPFLLRRFEAFVGRVASWVPLPIGLVTLLLLAALWRGPFLLLSLELTALAFVRARLSLLHIRAYSLSDYAFLTKLFLFMLLVVALTPVLGMLPPDLCVGAIAFVAALGTLLLGKSRRFPERTSTAPVLGLSVWLHQLLACSEPVRVGTIAVDRRLAPLGRMMFALAPALSAASLARLSRDTFVWFAPARAAAEVDVLRLVTLGAGAVKENHLAQTASDGRAALLVGVKSTAWQRHLGRYLDRSEERSFDVEWLRQTLKEIAPSSRCIDLADDFDPSSIAGYSARDIRNLVLLATRGRTGFVRLGSSEATVIAPGGDPKVLVLVPPGEANSKTWRADASDALRHAEVALVLSGARRSS